ncbi:hypothetical protein C7S20_16985 [Christiangramia fulva]|uniref:Uncharacterized protein n=1 Tax=Christiangramia fulva TaxID=2126553 RepID=A0A2R3Z974_9FLAO|nr:DUF6448 family protein [Christiangramia fulva]AVR46819.1 hypothetical protein C7S20_16985 [Christiangramia fulva]
MKNSAKPRSGNSKNLVLQLFLLLAFLTGPLTFAHCDSYDGPVIKDAYAALKAEKVAPVLKWIEPKYEDEITILFKKTLQYKEKDPQVYDLLKMHFFETLVRLHREGEGEPYTGLKPAGNISPVIQKSDAAMEAGTVELLLKDLNSRTGNLLKEKYERLLELKAHKEESTAQGRAFVAAYVDYTHTVKAIYDLLAEASDGHHVPAIEKIHKN